MTSGDPRGGGPDSGRIRPEVVLTDKSLAKSPFVRKVHTNVSSDVIQITEDKAIICLVENFDRLRERDAWKVPLGILATSVTVMLTAAPQGKFGLPMETWTALGWISTFLTGVWLVLDPGRHLLRLIQGEYVTPRSIVAQLKTITATVPDRGR